mmetsp:Transcript_7874/g.27111  ORF Transcript_7874/g.27111 Transcript_7874/m.27111 type:complete len:252 (-) Transcript_7874:152-907(-)
MMPYHALDIGAAPDSGITIMCFGTWNSLPCGTQWFRPSPAMSRMPSPGMETCLTWPPTDSTRRPLAAVSSTSSPLRYSAGAMASRTPRSVCISSVAAPSAPDLPAGLRYTWRCSSCSPDPTLPRTPAPLHPPWWSPSPAPIPLSRARTTLLVTSRVADLSAWALPAKPGHWDSTSGGRPEEDLVAMVWRTTPPESDATLTWSPFPDLAHSSRPSRASVRAPSSPGAPVTRSMPSRSRARRTSSAWSSSRGR